MTHVCHLGPNLADAMHSRAVTETPARPTPSPRQSRVTPAAVTGVILAIGGLLALVHPTRSIVIVALAGVGATVACTAAYRGARQRRILALDAERLRDSNRTMREATIRKDEFLASVSHELRTPLNVVLGYVDLLLDDAFGPLDESQRDVLGRINQNAASLSRLINDLIDLSRIEAGRLTVEPETIALTPIVGELAARMEVLLAGSQVTFASTIDPACDQLRADRERLKQVLSNLLVNAAKFTERGTIRLEVAPASDGRVSIAVTDTGIGIPAEKQAVIFEPFRQAHDHGRRYPGAGIGLAISARLAALMQGSLSVTSTPGEGARFTLHMPSAEPPLPPA